MEDERAEKLKQLEAISFWSEGMFYYSKQGIEHYYRNDSNIHAVIRIGQSCESSIMQRNPADAEGIMEFKSFG